MGQTIREILGMGMGKEGARMTNIKYRQDTCIGKIVMNLTKEVVQVGV